MILGGRWLPAASAGPVARTAGASPLSGEEKPGRLAGQAAGSGRDVSGAEAAALDGPGEDDSRLVAGDMARVCHGPVDLSHVVAVDGEDAGAERRRTAAVGLQIPRQLGRAALPHPVGIHHWAQIGEIIVRVLFWGV